MSQSKHHASYLSVSNRASGPSQWTQWSPRSYPATNQRMPMYPSRTLQPCRRTSGRLSPKLAFYLAPIPPLRLRLRVLVEHFHCLESLTRGSRSLVKAVRQSKRCIHIPSFQNTLPTAARNTETCTHHRYNGRNLRLRSGPVSRPKRRDLQDLVRTCSRRNCCK